MIGYKPLPGDDKILAPLTPQERAGLPMHGCRAWVRALKARGRQKRVKAALAKHHSALTASIKKGR
jgi:hypothetical protein